MIKHVAFSLILAFIAAPLQAADDDSKKDDSGQTMTGDAADACNMLVCLSDLKEAKQLIDCNNPLKKYYDMKPNKRPNFLAKCPVVK